MQTKEMEMNEAVASIKFDDYHEFLRSEVGKELEKLGMFTEKEAELLNKFRDGMIEKIK
jgi:hypothetical protein